MTMLDLEISGPDESAQPVHELELRFAPTRTRFVRLVDAESPGRHEFYSLSPLLVRIAFAGAVPTGEPHALTIEYVGESPSEPEPQWLPAALVHPLESSSFWSLDVNAPSRQDAVLRWSQGLDDETIRLARILKDERLEAIERLEDGVRKNQLDYFRALDQATNPNLLLELQQRQRRNLMLTFPVLLKDCLLCRRTGATPPPLDRAVVQDLSRLQLDLVRFFFRDQSSGIDIAAFNDAYLSFASGELMQSGAKTEARPDSAYFFLFAEFAIQAITANPPVDGPEWLDLLPVLVCAQELYPKAFPPFCIRKGAVVDVERRRFGTYKPLPTQPVDLQTERTRIEQTLATAMDPNALIARHAQNAFDAFPAMGEPTEPCQLVD